MSKIIQFSQITLDDFMDVLDERISKVVRNLTDNLESEKNKKDFYTRDETAKLFRVSLATLYNWAKEDILKPKKIGHRVYYSSEEVHSKLDIGL